LARSGKVQKDRNKKARPYTPARYFKFFFGFARKKKAPGIRQKIKA